MLVGDVAVTDEDEEEADVEEEAGVEDVEEDFRFGENSSLLMKNLGVREEFVFRPY